MTRVLYRKWRPMTFAEVIGQDHVTQTLCNALALGRVGHAYLFSGPRGTGKTTTARLLAKAVNCLDEELAARPCNACRVCNAITRGYFLDLIEIDAASNTGVDDVRDLREKIRFSPNEGRYKVYIIDEVHMLSTAAFNALLKTLEEPPPHAIFVLATTESHKIPATVISRCQRFEFRRIPLAEIVGRLEALLVHEEMTAEPAVLNLVARQATGSMRDAESLLDQLISSQSGAITLAYAQAVLGTASSEKIGQVVAAWIAGDSAAGLDAIQHAIEAGTDPQQFGRQTVDYLRGMLFLKTGGTIPSDLAESVHDMLSSQAGELELAELVGGVRRFSAAVIESKGGWQPQLPLELAFIECVNERRAASPSPDAGSRESAIATPLSGQAGRPAEGGDLHRPVLERDVSQAADASHLVEKLSPAGTLSVTDAQGRWDEMRAVLKQRKHFSVEALLNSGQLLGIEGQIVVLGFEHKLLREKMGADNNRQVVEQVLSEMLGTPLSVRCVDPRDYQPPPPASLDTQEIKRFAVEELDAEIVEIEL